MGKIVVLLLVSVMLFAGGLGGALYFRGMQDPAEAGKEGTEGANANTATGATPANGRAAATTTTELPVAFHGKPMSTEDVFRFTASIRGREKELRRREEGLEQRESRLKILENDLAEHRRAIDGKMQEVQTAIEFTEKTLQELVRQRQELKKEQSAAARQLDEARSHQAAVDKQGDARIKDLANWFAGLDENKAASQIKAFVDSGELHLAVRLLAEVEPRQVAKVLDVVDDPDLISQIMKAYHQLPKPMKK